MKNVTVKYCYLKMVKNDYDMKNVTVKNWKWRTVKNTYEKSYIELLKLKDGKND